MGGYVSDETITHGGAVAPVACNWRTNPVQMGPAGGTEGPKARGEYRGGVVVLLTARATTLVDG